MPSWPSAAGWPSANRWPSPGAQIAGATAITTAQRGWFWNNTAFTAAGSGGNTYFARSQGASVRIAECTDTSISLEAVPTTSINDYGNTIDVRVNGAYYATAWFTASVGVKNIQVVSLPAGAKLVELVEQGCYLTSITAAGSVQLATPQARNVLVHGASGSLGYYGWDESNVTPNKLVFDLCWFGRVSWSGRFNTAYKIAQNGAGITTWGIVDSASALAYVAANIVPCMTGLQENVLWCEFVAGECLNAASTPTVFAQRLGFYLDAVHTLLPTVKVFVQTAIIITSPSEATANGLGFLMQDYRDVCPAVVAARSSYVRLADGLQMGNVPGDLQDGKHEIPGFPATHVLGHVKAFNYVLPLLGT